MQKRILQNEFLQIEYLTEALRVFELKLPDGANLLVDISSARPLTTPYGDFHFLGGHRLWHSPEAMPRTYIPDAPVNITERAGGVSLEAPTEPGTGIRKQIDLALAPDRPAVTVTHTLTNEGLWTVELAPWAISQFRLGGTVILPMPVGNVDEAGLLANRQFALWPYARIQDPRLKLGDDFILFKADALPPFKIGYYNPHGWLAYYLEGTLFRKTFAAQTGVNYPDNNCNAEMYCNDKFVELESLGPLTHLAPGASVNHVEVWELFTDLSPLPEVLRAQLS